MKTITELANIVCLKHKYKKLNKGDSFIIREKYLFILNNMRLNTCESNKKIYSKSGLLISNGYKRIVIGDYGAFIEFDKSQAVVSNIIVKPGQEYRQQPFFVKTVKYFWLTDKNNSDIKIYYQLRTVNYADYKPSNFYVSHDDVILKDE